MPTIKAGDFERMRNGGRITSVRVQPTGTAVAGYQVNLGNRQSLRDIGVVGAPAWTAEQTETWARIERLSATCPRRLIVFEGGKSDIDKCMEFGDDFDGTTLNPEKWTTLGSPTISNSTITCPANSVSGARAINGFPSDFAIRFLATVGWSTAGSTILGTSNNSAAVYGPSQVKNSYGCKLAADDWAVDVDTATLDQSPHIYEIRVIGVTSRVLYRDGVQIGIITTTSHFNNNLKYPIITCQSGNASISAGWAALRKYTPNEPIAGTAQPSALNRSMCQSISLADGLRACIK